MKRRCRLSGKRKWIESEEGSLTIEASFVYPMILLATLSMVGFALFAYGKASLALTAETAAERTAYVWDNSRKDWETGASIPGRTTVSTGEPSGTV
ncbi:hypothetical protein N6H14_29545 [Paenibacillus sp. CC-CFT747]|nr:hypothetical protein N6H14_29545 [Paenibacillus sp. CC-CFT747]